MCGIFAYLNYGVERSRSAIINMHINGLRRLEYRGYDSAGIAVDGANVAAAPILFKAVGSIDALRAKVDAILPTLGPADPVFANHVGIAHTRWATHGVPAESNCHPHSSDESHEFLVVHNGIITNYKPLREALEAKGFAFYSETDTEIAAKLFKFLYDNVKDDDGNTLDFPVLMMHVMHTLEGAFALLVKSKFFPNEIVACKRGSPLVVGIKDLEFTQELMRVRNKSVNDLMQSPLMSPGIGSGGPLEVVGGQNFKRRRLLVEDGAVAVAAAAGADVPRESELFFSSDASAIVEHTKKVFYPEDNDVVHVSNGVLDLMHLGSKDNMQIAQSRLVSKLDLEIEQIMKGSYKHFMIKEIMEQPESILQSMRGRIQKGKDYKGDPHFTVQLGGIAHRLSDIKRSTRLIFIACGTSYNACLASRQLVEELSEMPVSIELASDFLDRQCPIFRSDVCFFISQSGETADVLEALKFARRHKALCIGIVNVVGSAITRLTECGVHLNAGAEIGVASTKVYTSEIAVMALIALQLSQDSRSKVRKLSSCEVRSDLLIPAGHRGYQEHRRQQVLRALWDLPALVEKCLSSVNDKIVALAATLSEDKSVLLFGRGYQYATCVEGALKIKEVTYMHTEGINAGELKHGPLALIDKDMPVIIFSSIDATGSKLLNALHQVMARGSVARMTVVCPEADDEVIAIATKAKVNMVVVPTTDIALQSILSIIPMQLLSYHIAVARNLDVDQPRNLAKCVTTE